MADERLKTGRILRFVRVYGLPGEADLKKRRLYSVGAFLAKNIKHNTKCSSTKKSCFSVGGFPQ